MKEFTTENLEDGAKRLTDLKATNSGPKYRVAAEGGISSGATGSSANVRKEKGIDSKFID